MKFPVLMLLLVVLVGCGASPEGETVDAAIARLTELAVARDYATLIDERYAETHKFRGPEDREALIHRFETTYGPGLVENLGKLSGIERTFSEDGAKVSWSAPGFRFNMVRSEDGLWRFTI